MPDRNSLTARAGWWGLALASVAGALCFVPLVGRVGFEFAFAMTPWTTLAGADLGIRAAGLRAATRRGLFVALVPVALMALNALRVKVCDWGPSLAMCALMPVVGAAVGAAWGRAAAVASAGRPGWSWVLVLGAAGGSLGVTGWRLLMEPPIFSYDPVIGFWPGALYDEALGVPEPLAAARLMHLLAGWSALAVAQLCRTPQRDRAGPSAWVPALGLVAALTALHAAGPAIGFRHDAASIAAELGRRTDPDPTLTVVWDRSIPAAEMDALVEDIRFRKADLATTLGRSPGGWGAVRVYVFRTRAQRRRLMGADRTAVARPWLGQIYLVRPEVGGILVAHELVHALGADLTSHPSGMPWTRLEPAMGLVEGLAVALAGSEQGPGLHASVAGMRALGIAPSPGSLMSSSGFYRQPASRAYAVAGSYLRFLLETRGPQALVDAYATGRTPQGLEREWAAMLDGIPVTESLRIQTERLYRRGAIYERVCPHEVALRRRQARRRAQTDPLGAVDAWRSVAEWDPGDPGHLLALARAYLAADQLPEARRAATSCAIHPAAPPGMKTSATVVLADIDWLDGQADAARSVYVASVGGVGRSAGERMVRAKAAASSPGRSADSVAAVRDWLLGRASAEAGLLALQRAALSEAWALPAYLIGRRLYGRGEWDAGVAWLAKARRLGLVDPLLAAENLRLLGRGAYRADQPSMALEAFEALEALAPAPGYVAGARSWRRRLAWRNRVKAPDVGED